MDETVFAKKLTSITNAILLDYQGDRAINRMDLLRQPDRTTLIDILNNLLKVLFPGYFKNGVYKIYHISSSIPVLIEDIAYHLNRQIEIALDETDERSPRTITAAFLDTIPRVRAYIETDVQATLDGDPAAENVEEIIISYPGLLAIAVYRLAHELYLLGVPVIPRVMSEYAHSVTGIDINPGATIGKYFFIDHGTGIVIGETAVLGDHVKIYQGVTIGALSTKGWRKLRNYKRHPTIEDNVTIYSGASILGGETVVGAGSVIGGNVFLTRSIAPGTRISVKNQELRYDKENSAAGGTDTDRAESWES